MNIIMDFWDRLERKLTLESHLVVHGRRSVKLSAFAYECIFLIVFWVALLAVLLNSFEPMPAVSGVWPR